MRSAFLLTVSLCLVGARVNVAAAQQWTPAVDAGMMLYILDAPAAQFDLRLSKEQRQAVKLLSGQFESVVRPVKHQTGRERVKAQRTAWASERDTRAKLYKILSATQLERIEQIAFQYPTGPQYLLQPNLAARLHLTAQQAEMVGQLTAQAQVVLSQMDLLGMSAAEVGMARYQMLRTFESQTADLVLSDQQAAALRDALGAPFDWAGTLSGQAR